MTDQDAQVYRSFHAFKCTCCQDFDNTCYASLLDSLYLVIWQGQVGICSQKKCSASEVSPIESSVQRRPAHHSMTCEQSAFAT